MKRLFLFGLLLLPITGCKECHCNCYDTVSVDLPQPSIHLHKFGVLHTYGEPHAVLLTPDSAKTIWWYRACNNKAEGYEFFVFFNGDTAYGIRN